MIGLVLLLGFVLIALFAPWIAPTLEEHKNEPYRVPRFGWGSSPSPPTKEHPMGLTQGKYDVFYGIIWGTRTAFQVGLIVTGLSCLLGVLIGSVSAYIGGKFDEVIMRFVDVFMSFPFLIAAIVITAVLGRGLDKVIIALVLFRWTGYARLIRGSVLQVKQDEYIMAARAGGVSHPAILVRHIIPNTIFPVLIQASMNMGSIVVTAATLSFLGLGAPEGYADWGQMISFARNWVLGSPGEPLKYWYTVVWPGAAIVLFVLSWNLIGDAFRDIMDPRIQA